jgi:hypothetical protein
VLEARQGRHEDGRIARLWVLHGLGDGREGGPARWRQPDVGRLQGIEARVNESSTVPMLPPAAAAPAGA